MHRSPLGCRGGWTAAIYLMLASLKGVASTKLARDLGITQKSRLASESSHAGGVRRREGPLVDGTGGDGRDVHLP